MVETTVTDLFARPNNFSLGNNWEDASTWFSNAYEPLGIYNNSVVVSDPMHRGPDSMYEPLQHSSHPYVSGLAHVGIGAAWRNMGSAVATVSLEWSGMWDNLQGHHVEGAPCVHFVPGTPELALGIWPSEVFDIVPVFLIGPIGYPPEEFTDMLMATAQFSHIDGTPRNIEIRTDGTACTFWLDGVQIELVGHNGHPDYGLDPMPVPTSLQGSTLHGFELDTHLVSPPVADISDIPTIPVVNSWTCTVDLDTIYRYSTPTVPGPISRNTHPLWRYYDNIPTGKMVHVNSQQEGIDTEANVDITTEGNVVITTEQLFDSVLEYPGEGVDERTFVNHQLTFYGGREYIVTADVANILVEAGHAVTPIGPPIDLDALLGEDGLGLLLEDGQVLLEG